MAENSGIAWTTHTFNPWIGCTKVSTGCDHCYAEAWNQRFDGGANWGPGAPRRRTKPQNWSKVRRWQRDRADALDNGNVPPRVRVFVASLADVFDNEVSQVWRQDLWDLIDECFLLDWIFATKRIGNVARMKPTCGFPGNVIILSTIVNQAEADRDLDKLIDLKDRNTVSQIGVSYEPALGPVDWSTWISDLDWLIVGGESAQGSAKARLFDLEWARSAVAQCRAASVPVFVKQMGSTPVETFAPGCDHFLNFAARAGADPSEWPADLRIREFWRRAS